MQVKHFSSGGLVIHKIGPRNGAAHYSAWYDAAGRLLDAERIDRLGRVSQVKPDGSVWRLLEGYGVSEAAKGTVMA